MKTLIRSCLLVATVVVFTAAPSPAQQDRPQDGDVAVSIRTYNVADLIRGQRDYPLEDGDGNSLFTEKVKKTSSGDDRVGSLIQLLQQMVDTGSWHDNGGTVGQVKVFGTLLVIAQTDENHQQIEQLLDAIRREEGPARLVSITAHWMVFQPEDMNAIRQVGGNRPPAAGPVVPAELLDAGKMYWRAQTVCFSGQTVHLSAGSMSTYVSDVTPIVGTQAVAYDPELGEVQNGISLQLTPQLVPNIQIAIVDVQSSINETGDRFEPIAFRTELSGATTQPVVGGEGTTFVERIRTVRQEFGTTARLPLGKPCLVAGMTMQPATADAPARQVYLVLEVNATE